MFVATFSGTGVVRTTDGGTTWRNPLVLPERTAAAQSALPIGVNGLAMDPWAENTLYLGTRDIGVVKSTDGGASWTKTGPGGIGRYVRVAADPATANTVYAGAKDRVFRTTDGGTSWEVLGTGLPRQGVATLAIGVGVTNTKVYAGLYNAGAFRLQLERSASQSGLSCGRP